MLPGIDCAPGMKLDFSRITTPARMLAEMEAKTSDFKPLHSSMVEMSLICQNSFDGDIRMGLIFSKPNSALRVVLQDTKVEAGRELSILIASRKPCPPLFFKATA
ncbi:hypothetical protein H101_01715 [Trichophyton interdigitale H6]|nr:hypothetical protein H101_01715 [Trichophyton interdigitale H6]